MASVATVAASHWAVIKAAFICDLVRVATFQFEPGTGHVGFKGLFPGDEGSTYRHHPISHEIAGFLMDQATPPPPHSSPPVLEFLMNVEQWYNLRFAELLADFNATTDPFGNNLLGTTVIPYVTEVRSTGHARNQMPAIIFGGRDLGMLGGQYRPENVTINSLWGTIAQPFDQGARRATAGGAHVRALEEPGVGADAAIKRPCSRVPVMPSMLDLWADTGALR